MDQILNYLKNAEKILDANEFSNEEGRIDD
jgi:hypothetical protein